MSKEDNLMKKRSEDAGGAGGGVLEWVCRSCPQSPVSVPCKIEYKSFTNYNTLLYNLLANGWD